LWFHEGYPLRERFVQHFLNSEAARGIFELKESGPIVSEEVAAASEELLGLEVAERTAAEGTASLLEREVIGLFDQLRRPLLRYLMSARIAPAEAEEIVQETFVLLFQHLRRGKSRENLPAWLFSVAHRLGLKQHARARRRADRLTFAPEFERTADMAYPGPHERLELIERRERLMTEMGALPERDQRCLSLRAEGLRYRDIAGVLGISLGSVANSLERAMARLTRAAGF
jgi:RNA polymerase sigma-70 factor (ECF subfamily)